MLGLHSSPGFLLSQEYAAIYCRKKKPNDVFVCCEMKKGLKSSLFCSAASNVLSSAYLPRWITVVFRAQQEDSVLTVTMFATLPSPLPFSESTCEQLNGWHSSLSSEMTREILNLFFFCTCWLWRTADCLKDLCQNDGLSALTEGKPSCLSCIFVFDLFTLSFFASVNTWGSPSIGRQCSPQRRIRDGDSKSQSWQGKDKPTGCGEDLAREPCVFWKLC